MTTHTRHLIYTICTSNNSDMSTTYKFSKKKYLLFFFEAQETYRDVRCFFTSHSMPNVN